MQVVGKNHTNLNGDHFINGLEHKFLKIISLVISILFGIDILVGILLQDPVFAIASSLATLICISIFFMVRRAKLLKISAWIMVLTTLVMINFIWFRFEGSKGVSVMIILTLLISVSMFLRKTGSTATVAVVILNMLLLLFIEYKLPHLVQPYPAEILRLVNIFVVFALSSILAVFIIQMVLASYHDAKVKAEQANRLKSAFLENVSHEIRTPMNAIIGFSSILTKSDISRNDKLLYTGFINSACKNLMNSIDEIIDMARIESNQYMVNKNLCSIPETLNYVYHYFTDVPGRRIRKNVNFVLNPESLQIDVYVDTDSMLLKQVLIFLLDNAIKYTHTGFIEFGCKPQQECFQFYVQDTGIGIPKKEQDHVFESFLKIDSQNGKIYRGVGLGLTLSKKMITLLGGKIWLESEESRGTTFFFSLPRAA